MNDEFEIVTHKNLPGLQVFFVDLRYREPHAHSDLECCLLLEGRAEIKAQGQSLTLEPDDFALLRPCLPHEIWAVGESALFLTIQVQPGLCRNACPAEGLDFAFRTGRKCLPEEEMQAVRSRALDLARAYWEREDGFAFRCMAQLNWLLYSLTRYIPRENGARTGRQEVRDQRVRRLLHYLETHCQQKLLLSELAEREGLTVSYLSHFFKENLHVTFQEYLAGLRCEKARQLLLNPGYTLLDVSVESGFSDVKYLNRAFAARYGCTPREYRRQGMDGDWTGPAPGRRAAQTCFTQRQSLELLNRLTGGNAGARQEGAYMNLK